MSQHLFREIEKLKQSILKVGKLVEDSLGNSVTAFAKRDKELADRVRTGDDAINKMEIEVEEECLKILALHQPVAIDLRYIIATLKINNDLERIGDLSANIATRVASLVKLPSVPVPESIYRISDIVQTMLRNSLKSLVTMDAELARNVLTDDDIVDKLHGGMYTFTENSIRSDPENLSCYIQLLTISRYLERAADHATNIAEDVLYLVNGEISRHRF